jgi:ribulose bisphosphate carboxylase small subunit
MQYYNNTISEMETQEMIQKLINNGYGDLIDCLLGEESLVYTKKGRLNKSSTCRKMGWKNKQLEDALKEMKDCLEEENHLNK